MKEWYATTGSAMGTVSHQRVSFRERYPSAKAETGDKYPGHDAHSRQTVHSPVDHSEHTKDLCKGRYRDGLFTTLAHAMLIYVTCEHALGQITHYSVHPNGETGHFGIARLYGQCV